jgi:hypothetical protein
MVQVAKTIHALQILPEEIPHHRALVVYKPRNCILLDESELTLILV